MLALNILFVYTNYRMRKRRDTMPPAMGSGSMRRGRDGVSILNIKILRISGTV